MAVAELKAKPVKDNFSVSLLCTNFALLKTKAGKSYINFTAQDGDGSIVCNNWDYSASNVPINGVYELQGTVDTFNGNPQLNVKTMLKNNDANLNDYTVRLLDIDDFRRYTEQLISLINHIESEEIRDIVHKVYKDFGLYDRDVENTPLYGTAALSYHHVGLGGFIKHTVDTALKAYNFAHGFYSSIIKSLVLGGALVHDIGKLLTYAVKDGAFVMTKRGESLEHIVIGTMILELYKTNQNKGSVLALQNIICSHHGCPEWGAARPVMSIEAYIVSTADKGDCLEYNMLELQGQNPEQTDLFRTRDKEWMYGYKGTEHLLSGKYTEPFAEDFFYTNYKARSSSETVPDNESIDGIEEDGGVSPKFINPFDA